MASKKIKQKISWSSYYLLIVFALQFIVIFPIIWFLLRVTKSYVLVDKIRKKWSVVFFLFSGIKPKLVISENAKKIEKGIFCANHSSYLDIPCMSLATHLPLSFMAKAELLKIPLFSVFFKTVDIAVHRSKSSLAYLAYQQAIEKLNNGFSIVNYPEGGILDGTKKLFPFKDGAFKMAIETKTPIVPVVILDTYKILKVEPQYMDFYPGECRIVVLDPILTNAMTMKDVEYLKNLTFELINKVLNEN